MRKEECRKNNGLRGVICIEIHVLAGYYLHTIRFFYLLVRFTSVRRDASTSKFPPFGTPLGTSFFYRLHPGAVQFWFKLSPTERRTLIYRIRVLIGNIFHRKRPKFHPINLYECLFEMKCWLYETDKYKAKVSHSSARKFISPIFPHHNSEFITMRNS